MAKGTGARQRRGANTGKTRAEEILEIKPGSLPVYTAYLVLFVPHAERAKVATEGWGARLLALQGADGQWGGGTYLRGAGDRADPFVSAEIPVRKARTPTIVGSPTAAGFAADRVFLGTSTGLSPKQL